MRSRIIRKYIMMMEAMKRNISVRKAKVVIVPMIKRAMMRPKLKRLIIKTITIVIKIKLIPKEILVI